MGRGSRLALGVAAVVAVSVLPFAATPASAVRNQDGGSIQQLQRQRDEVRQKKASQASQVNVLQASDAEVSAALSTLSSNVSASRTVSRRPSAPSHRPPPSRRLPRPHRPRSRRSSTRSRRR